MTFRSHFQLLVALISLLLCFNAQALMTVQESAEITPAGKYKVGIEPQVITSTGGGTNVTGFFDAAVNEESSFRVLLGTGHTDFYAGGSFKWVPFPDFEDQPAVGGKFSAIYGKQDDLNLFVFRFDPIISKKFETDIGFFVPYGALPINHVNLDGHTDVGIQIAAGTEYINNQLDNVTFGVEIGFDVSESFSYISGFATIYLDEETTRSSSY